MPFPLREPVFRGAAAVGCVHRFVERQAERTPDAEAFRWRGGRVRYRELDERANRLAHLLRRHGVGGGDRVGVCLRRGPELVVAVLAVLKAGACLVAMDPAHPARRAEFAAADSGARLLLTERAVRDRLWPGGAPVGAPGRVVCREELDPAGVPATRPPVRVGPGDLAYLTYTSGATGTPKGVLVEHRSVAALLSWVGEAFTARELDGVLAATSACSDLSVFEIFGPLAHGGRFVLADTGPDPVAPGAVEGVRLLSTVPSTMRELLAADAVPPGVETVCLAGEPLTEDLAHRVWRLPGLRRLLNLYGSAEVTACSTWAEVGRDHRGTPPIGVPLPGTRAYVLDDAGAEAPPGAVGELHLAGDGLARGYLGRPEEERARFLPDPFAARPGERVHRTGDRVRRRPDGWLEFVGRREDLVELRGHRVELGEVAAGLEALPGVRASAAAVVTGPAGAPRLVGYVVGDRDGRLLDRLRERVPGYLVPGELVWLDRLPRTASGKVDRAALPHVGRGGLPGPRRRSGAGPVDEVERVVAETWREVLGVRVRRTDDFFALGGDSVLAARAVVRLRVALDRAGLDRAVLLPALLANPTVARLAAHLRRAPVGGPPAARPTAEARLSPAQQRLWSLQRADPLDPSCLISLLVRLDGPVHVDRLTAALRGVVAEHEALRTSFALVGDRPVQRVAAEAPLPLRRTDLDESADPDAEPARLALADAAEPVEPGSPPLLRCRLVARAGRVVALVVTAHRLVFDERSADLFVRDLARRYDRPDDHRSHPGPAVFAERQLDRLAGPGGREAVAAVADSVRGAPDLLALPTDLPRGPRAARAGRHLAIDLDPAVAEAVRATAPAHRATPYMVGLAAFAVLLRRWCGQPDLLVGTTFAGRTDPESDGTIGCFATLLPVRLRPDPARPFTELLAQARRSALLVAAHQDVPPARSPGEPRRGPLVRVSFGYRDAPQRVHRGGGVVFRACEVERDEVRLDLALCLVEGPHGLTARWAYRADLFHERTVRRLHERYAALLADATARPRTAVRDLADA